MNGCHFYISHLINKSSGNGKLPLDTTQKTKNTPFTPVFTAIMVSCKEGDNFPI